MKKITIKADVSPEVYGKILDLERAKTKGGYKVGGYTQIGNIHFLRILRSELIKGTYEFIIEILIQEQVTDPETNRKGSLTTPFPLLSQLFNLLGKPDELPEKIPLVEFIPDLQSSDVKNPLQFNESPNKFPISLA